MKKRKRSGRQVFLGIRIDDGLRRRVRIAAVRRGTSVQSLVLEALTALLAKPEAEKADGAAADHER